MFILNVSLRRVWRN